MDKVDLEVAGPKIPLDWRRGLSAALAEYSLKVPSVPLHLEPFKGSVVDTKLVSFAMDASNVHLDARFGAVDIRVSANCPGEIPSVAFRLRCGGKTLGEVFSYDVTAEQRLVVKHAEEGSGLKVECDVGVFYDVEEPCVRQVCLNFELPFHSCLIPCVATSWCSGGDKDVFRGESLRASHL